MMNKLILLFTIFLLFSFPKIGFSNPTADPVEANFTFENACLFQPVLFTDISVGNVTAWSWDFDNGSAFSAEQDPEFNFFGSGEYLVQLIVSNDCESDTMIQEITIYNAIPTFRDTTVCNNESVEVNGKFYTESVLSNQVFNYIDTLVSSQGCDSITIFRITVNPCGCELIFPNAFTPDGDGLNDTFQPVVICDQIIANYRMIILDRWGETVYDTFEYNDPWDGTINGYPIPMDVFVYWVQYEIVDGDNRRVFNEANDFTLIR
jgi:gliding motility-associated-like protein